MADPTEGTLAVGDTSDKLDTTVVTHEDGTEAHREGVFVGDPATAAARAAVNKDALTSDYGVVARDPQIEDVILALHAVLDELREIKMHLNLITEFES